MPLHLISNEQLLLERIPDPEAELWGWERFAHTINGYEVMGGFEPCADLANSGGVATLTELRCALFFEARRERSESAENVDTARLPFFYDDHRSCDETVDHAHAAHGDPSQGAR